MVRAYPHAAGGKSSRPDPRNTGSTSTKCYNNNVGRIATSTTVAKFTKACLRGRDLRLGGDVSLCTGFESWCTYLGSPPVGFITS